MLSICIAYLNRRTPELTVPTFELQMSMYGDVSDILREQIRQEDLWLQEYFTADI